MRNMHPEKYLPELIAEKDTLEPSFVHAARLLTEEIEKCDGDDFRKDGDLKKYLDIISNKNIKLSERVLIPVQQYPKFNFVGKLLGPRGNSMKRLQEETGVKMSILGKGSMRDKEKTQEQSDADIESSDSAVFSAVLETSERPSTSTMQTQEQTSDAHIESSDSAVFSAVLETSERPSTSTMQEEELRKSGEAKYTHLNNDLHVLIEVFAPPGEAYSRMSHALEEIKKFLVPDYNDEIRQEQLRELSLLNGSEESRGRGAQSRGTRPAATTNRGHRGSTRNAVAPRGSAAATHSKPPTAVVSRDAQPPRARGAAASNAYRPPLIPATHEAFDDYGFDDGYGGEYDEESYEGYEDNYSNQSKSISDYYEYSHANSGEDTYNNYEEEWPTSRPALKAPILRLTRGGFRKHPYGRY